tara:strand:- start:856 stop:1062 length:207 start_codon:yes stop_codon:yes gene_type:complete
MTFLLFLAILVYFTIRMKATINKINEIKLNEIKHRKNNTKEFTQFQNIAKYNNMIYFGDHALGHMPMF